MGISHEGLIAADADRVARLEVVLVDDSPAAAMLARLAIEETGLGVDLVVVTRNQDAYIHLTAHHEYCKQPPVVLLDINLGNESGFDLLKGIRQAPELKHIPVIMLTSSSLPGDRRRAAAHGAQDYWIKPNDFGAFVEMLRGLARFFL